MKMTKEKRALYDAQADVEAWEFALSILRPWVDAAQAIGSPELSRVMDEAEGVAWSELDRAQDELAKKEK
jgi:hypothetical protein